MIEKAREADIGEVVGIYEAVIDKEARGETATGWVKGVYPSEDTVREAFQKNDLFVMREEGKVVAAARINQEQVAEYALADWEYPVPDDKIMVIHTLAIHPAEAGKGYGTKFIGFYEEYARTHGCEVLRMDTNVTNKPARALYKKLGYKDIGRVTCIFNGIRNVQLICLEKKLNRD